MTDYKISLCLAYPNYNNPDIQILFRVADYNFDEDKLCAIQFHEDDFIESPRRIGANPKELYAGMTTMRKWEFDTDNPGKTRSYSYDEDVYEIIYPRELSQVDYADSNAIRSVLCNGFSMDNYVAENLLIAIGKQGSHNALLHCRKRDLKKVGENLYAISSDTRDMMHSVHCLEEYDIVDNDIIDSSNLNISLPSGFKAPVRYFYSRTVLPELVRIFHPIDFSKYISTFVSNYIKKNKNTLSFTSNETRKIVDILESALHDQEYITEFFKLTGYTSEQLQELLFKYKDTIVDSLLGNDSIDLILRKYLLEDQVAYNRCVELVRESWLAEQTEEKEQILCKLDQLKKQHSEIEAEIATKCEQKESLSAEIITAESTIASKKEGLKKIQLDIETELQNFSDNIVRNAAICAIARNSSTETNLQNPAVDIITLEPDTSGEPELLDDYDDFQEALADNLIAVGYEDLAADEMAQLISFCISARLPILLTSNEDKIALCIAAMFNTSVKVLNIGTSLNPKDYISALKESGGSVFLINGAFAGFSAEHFNSIRYHLAREGFVVLFSVDESDVALISKGVLNNSMCLACGYYFKYSNATKLDSYNVDYSIFSRLYNEADVLSEAKKLNDLIDAGIINSVIASNYARFMYDINCNIKKDWLILYQLCLHAKSNFKSDVMRTWLENNDIDINIINSFL